jgi:hypothetical protein
MKEPEQVELSIETVGERGALEHMFNAARDQILENIYDIKTDPEAVREMTIKVRFKPDERRYEIATALAVTTKLAPAMPVGGRVWLGQKDGKLTAVGYDLRQRQLFPETEDPSITPITDRMVKEGPQ